VLFRSYEKAGIYLKAEKKALLNARLGKRLRAGKFSSFEEYFKFVISDSSGHELIELINSVSTNFTSFFREKDHFDYLETVVLPALITGRRPPGRELFFWSSACSSGEEPYTLAMVTAEFFARHLGQQHRILATDISTKVLDLAEKGIYALDRIEKVPAHLKPKYFQKGVGRSAGFVKVREELRRLVTFKRLNLMEPFPWDEAVDVLFCRNVMIYFNHETQQRLIEKFHKCLAPNGYLFIGHSESLTFIRHNFKQVATTVYQKT